MLLSYIRGNKARNNWKLTCCNLASEIKFWCRQAARNTARCTINCLKRHKQKLLFEKTVFYSISVDVIQPNTLKLHQTRYHFKHMKKVKQFQNKHSKCTPSGWRDTRGQGGLTREGILEAIFTTSQKVSITDMSVMGWGRFFWQRKGRVSHLSFWCFLL